MCRISAIDYSRPAKKGTYPICGCIFFDTTPQYCEHNATKTFNKTIVVQSACDFLETERDGIYYYGSRKNHGKQPAGFACASGESDTIFERPKRPCPVHGEMDPLSYSIYDIYAELGHTNEDHREIIAYRISKGHFEYIGFEQLGDTSSYNQFGPGLIKEGWEEFVDHYHEKNGWPKRDHPAWADELEELELASYPSAKKTVSKYNFGGRRLQGKLCGNNKGLTN